MARKGIDCALGPTPEKGPIFAPPKPRYNLRNTPARQQRLNAVAAAKKPPAKKNKSKKKAAAGTPGKVTKPRGPGRPRKKVVFRSLTPEKTPPVAICL